MTPRDTYRDELTAALAAKAAAEKRLAELTTQKPKQRPPFRVNVPAVLRRIRRGITVGRVTGAVVLGLLAAGAIGIGKCAANKDNVDYCYVQAERCYNAGRIGCPDRYILMLHRPWNEPDFVVDENHKIIEIDGREAARAKLARAWLQIRASVREQRQEILRIPLGPQESRRWLILERTITDPVFGTAPGLDHRWTLVIDGPDHLRCECAIDGAQAEAIAAALRQETRRGF